MSVAATNTVFSAIVSDLLALAQLVLEDDSVSVNTKVGKNTLKDSALRRDLSAEMEGQGRNSTVIKALFNNYVGYIEWTRPPKYKTKPPIDALKDWADKNGIPSDAETLWKISYAIWRDGHQGRPIFATIDAQLDGIFDTDWSEALTTAILDNVHNFFNNGH